MKTRLRTILSLTILSLYGFAFVGCNKGSSSTDSVSLNQQDDHDHDHDDHDDEHDHDEHDHDEHDDDEHDHDEHDHDEHDHPAHGPHGGHMIELGGDAKAEWMLDNEAELIAILFDNVENVSKVEMKTNIAGTETVYEFEELDTPSGPGFGLTSPELATAVKMGEAVETKLVVTTDEGELTGPVVYHAH